MAPKSEQFRVALSVLLGMGLTWLKGERVERWVVFGCSFAAVLLYDKCKL